MIEGSHFFDKGSTISESESHCFHQQWLTTAASAASAKNGVLGPLRYL